MLYRVFLVALLVPILAACATGEVQNQSFSPAAGTDADVAYVVIGLDAANLARRSAASALIGPQVDEFGLLWSGYDKETGTLVRGAGSESDDTAVKSGFALRRVGCDMFAEGGERCVGNDGVAYYAYAVAPGAYAPLAAYLRIESNNMSYTYLTRFRGRSFDPADDEQIWFEVGPDETVYAGDYFVDFGLTGDKANRIYSPANWFSSDPFELKGATIDRVENNAAAANAYLEQHTDLSGPADYKPYQGSLDAFNAVPRRATRG